MYMHYIKFYWLFLKYSDFLRQDGDGDDDIIIMMMNSKTGTCNLFRSRLLLCKMSSFCILWIILYGCGRIEGRNGQTEWHLVGECRIREVSGCYCAFCMVQRDCVLSLPFITSYELILFALHFKASCKANAWINIIRKTINSMRLSSMVWQRQCTRT